MSVLLLRDHGFVLHKSDFHDALCLRYGWLPALLPQPCVCGVAFSVEHVLSCPRGGFLFVRHNKICDSITYLLREICHDACTEPGLQHLNGETYSSTVKDDDAHLDIAAHGF